ncbi:MAG: VCBS repeat-containing protein [Cyanobacteria bacterium J06649_5]
MSVPTNRYSTKGSATASADVPFQFRAHIIDTDLSKRRYYAQTALADIDNDGQLEFVMGQQYGNIYWYKRNANNRWTRYLLGRNSPSDVGACAFDVDGDGWVDFVTGGAWYQNPRIPGKPFKRHVFDRRLKAVHDLVAADIDGDGQLEVLTMSDKNNLRWYKIPADPTQRWEKHDIGTSVHAGLCVGDIDGDGDLDIVRSNVWLENVNGNGSEWIWHPIGPSSMPPADFCPPFAYNATRSQVCDVNQDGNNDIVFTDAEIPGGSVWWMENIDGKGLTWKRHEIYTPPKSTNADTSTPNEAKEDRRGAYHSLYVGDLDGDGDWDVFSCEMEIVRGERAPRFYIWENVDGKGMHWKEHVVLDINLGGHETVIGDITGNGTLDMLTKPWRAHQENALQGKMYVMFLENVFSRALRNIESKH